MLSCHELAYLLLALPCCRAEPGDRSDVVSESLAPEVATFAEAWAASPTDEGTCARSKWRAKNRLECEVKTLTDGRAEPILWIGGKSMTQRASTIIAKRKRVPSTATLERWQANGGCKALDGCWVEPDGHCEHGSESWLLYLGYI